MAIPDNIRSVRKSLGLTQAAFAEKLGVKTSAVGNWEGGTRKVPMTALTRIAAILGASLDYLKTGEGEMFASAAQESTSNLPSPYESARAHGCSEAIAKIYARYCALPDEEKAIFERIVDSLVEEKAKRPKLDGGGISINNVYGDNNPTIN